MKRASVLGGASGAGLIAVTLIGGSPKTGGKVATLLPGFEVGYAHILGQSDSDLDGKVDVYLDGANISPDRLNIAAEYSRGRLISV